MARQDAGAAFSIERFFQFSLLGMAASSFLAIAGSGYLDFPAVALTAAALVLRGLMLAELVTFRVSARALSLTAAAFAGVFALDYLLFSQTLAGATIHLTFLLAALKIVTASSNRDAFFTALISFAGLVFAAVLSINVNFIICLACYLVFAIATLTSAEIRRGMKRANMTARTGHSGANSRLALLAGSVAGGILILTGGLFFLLPRTAEAALSSWVSQRTLLPGFSNRVTLGEVGAIRADTRAVMHINSPKPQALAGLKWRGGGLTHFDGKRWTNPGVRWEPVEVDDRQSDFTIPQEPQPGRYIGYEVTLDASGMNALFFAGKPRVIRASDTALDFNDTDNFRMRDRVPEGFHYEAYSRLEDPPELSRGIDPATLTPEQRDRNLRLPPIDPRIPALARNLTTGALNDLDRARFLERRLHSDYAYALETPSRAPADPLADFLFVRKRGYCEYFASAMTVMLRTLGVPARMATGFQSGVYNSITSLWVIRASDAHAWVEAWIPGHGWTTFDPTPPDPNGREEGAIARLGLYLDAASTFWRQWVVGYDPERQGALAGQLQRGARLFNIRWLTSSWEFLTTAGTSGRSWLSQVGNGPVLAVVFCVILWFGGRPAMQMLRLRLRYQRVRRGRVSAGDASLLYARMLKIMKRHGYHKPAWFTPVEFAASLPRTELKGTVTEFTVLYNALRFGGRAQEAPRLSGLLDELDRYAVGK